MSVPRLEHLACVVVDIDEFLTKAGVNVWYELTKQIFLKAGYTLEQAMVAVEKHKQIYGKFRDRVSNLDPIKDHAEYEAAYTEMVTGIKSLYESSGLELTRENLADCKVYPSVNTEKRSKEDRFWILSAASIIC